MINVCLKNGPQLAKHQGWMKRTILSLFFFLSHSIDVQEALFGQTWIKGFPRIVNLEQLSQLK